MGHEHGDHGFHSPAQIISLLVFEHTYWSVGYSYTGLHHIYAYIYTYIVYIYYITHTWYKFIHPFVEWRFKPCKAPTRHTTITVYIYIPLIKSHCVWWLNNDFKYGNLRKMPKSVSRILARQCIPHHTQVSNVFYILHNQDVYSLFKKK
jgi:hypothetical protein